MIPKRLDLDPTSREALEFDLVLGLVASHAGTPLGAARVRALEPLADREAIEEEHALVEETGRVLGESGRLVAGGLPDPSPVLALLALEGARIGAAEIRDLALVVLAASDLRARLLALESPGFPGLLGRGRALPDVGGLARPVLRNVSPEGRIADEASEELRRIRTALGRVGERLRRTLESMLRDPGGEHGIRDDFVTQRNGRFVIPVRSDSPRHVPGIVHAASSSGATLFVEPMETVELNNELVQLAEAEIEEQERIVVGWAGQFRERLPEVMRAIAALAEADSLQARALFGSAFEAIRPRFQEGGALVLGEVRHPLLERRLRDLGRRAVPATLEFGCQDRILLLSGPNTGGKTVALKTLGLATLMAQSGIPVCAERAQLPVFGQIRADIGDHQSIEADLSTFSAHVQALARFLRECRPPVLFLFDEIGTGTDPVEGAALARAVLERLLVPGCTTVATTHQGTLKAWAFSTPGALSAALEFDSETLRPTYRVLMGAAGASAGIEVAARFGVEEQVVEKARAYLGGGSAEVEALMGRLRSLTSELERQRDELVARESELALERERLKGKIASATDRVRREATAALEKSLREFREEGRRELQDLHDLKERARLERVRARAERRLALETERKKGEIAATLSGGEAPVLPAVDRPEAGLRVVVRSLGREGEIVSSRGDRVDVRLGQAVFTVHRSDLRAVAAAPARPAADPSWATGGRGLVRPIDDLGGAPSEIVLIGKTAEEGLAALDKFLDDSALAGKVEIRVVHGHGTGRLRAAVRKFLSSHPHVESFRPGGEHEGGDAATLVRIK